MLNCLLGNRMSFDTTITTKELKEKLLDKNVVILDASWHMPATGKDAYALFKNAHIPNARFFDIDSVCVKSAPFPHTVPDTKVFSEAAGRLGISNDDTIIIYDNSDLHSSARVWWLFRLMGHQKIHILDGGFKKWCADGLPLSCGDKPFEKATFKAKQQNHLLKSKEDILKIIDTKDTQIVDARGAARYDGLEPEPRPGLRAGHIPTAVNLPFSKLYNDDHTIKSKDELADIIASHSIDLDMPIVTSCGSGVTACNLAYALAELGKWDTAVYDGSWTEWGSLHELPIENKA